MHLYQINMKFKEYVNQLNSILDQHPEISDADVYSAHIVEQTDDQIKTMNLPIGTTTWDPECTKVLIWNRSQFDLVSDYVRKSQESNTND